MYDFRKTHTFLVIFGLILGVLLALLIGLMVGSVKISATDIANRIIDKISGTALDDSISRIIFLSRLPRLISAASSGCALALAGLSTQTLFKNPLATPSVIGISNGAALGAIIAQLVSNKLSLGFFELVPLCSILSGLTTTAIIFVLSRKSIFFGYSLLLAGIAISSICSSIMTALLYISGERLQSIMFWLMGGLWLTNWTSASILMLLAFLVLIILLFLSPSMNVALIGEGPAHNLGLNVKKFQQLLLAVIAITTSLVVSVTGVIGFIGLVVPHLARLIIGTDNRFLVPASALGGAFLLIVADTLARTLASPAEIPVGIFTAIIGAPIFLWILQKKISQTYT